MIHRVKFDIKASQLECNMYVTGLLGEIQRVHDRLKTE